jgi:hypothetical protein
MTRPYTTHELLVKRRQVAVFVAVWDTEMSAARPLTTAQTRQNRDLQITLAKRCQIGICEGRNKSRARPERRLEGPPNQTRLETPAMVRLSGLRRRTAGRRRARSRATPSMSSSRFARSLATRSSRPAKLHGCRYGTGNANRQVNLRIRLMKKCPVAQGLVTQFNPAAGRRV